MDGVIFNMDGAFIIIPHREVGEGVQDWAVLLQISPCLSAWTATWSCLLCFCPQRERAGWQQEEEEEEDADALGRIQSCGHLVPSHTPGCRSVVQVPVPEKRG